METKPFRVLSCSTIFLLFVVLIHAHEQSSPKGNFLNSLIGSKKGDSTEGVSELKHYLSKFGYMFTSSTHNNTFDDSLEKGIRKYQKFFKLVETGTLDASTVKQMSKSRCGVPDFPVHSSPLEESHYAFFPRNPKWTKRHLTFALPPATRSDAYLAIRVSADLWSGVSPFTFSYTKDFNAADIRVSFKAGDHGDGYPFDGPGGVLAHAFGPNDGRLHYDADEEWVYGVVRGGVDLQTVALHELGHVLGLGHSADETAIMAPNLGTGMRKGLGQDDIDGISELYDFHHN